jgi:transcriptional regulator with XRE-family HTH domain
MLACMELTENVARNIRSLRLAAGVRQEELADAMRTFGLPWYRGTVSEVEAFRRPVTLAEGILIASYFEQPLANLLVSPGLLAPAEITIGKKVILLADWSAVINATPWRDGPPPKPVRRALANLFAGTDRLWASLWRAGHPADAFTKAREKAMASRTRFPGPTFLADVDIEISSTFPLWGQNRRIYMAAGVPYVARDEWEADLLEANRQVRRITRQQAHRLRQAKGDQS